MIKKTFALLLCVAVILSSVSFGVKADTDSFNYPPYTCTGNCSIQAYSASASTSSYPQTSVEVEALYIYVTNPGSTSPDFQRWPKSNGSNDGGTSVTYSISNTCESYSITCTHTITGSDHYAHTYERYYP